MGDIKLADPAVSGADPNALTEQTQRPTPDAATCRKIQAEAAIQVKEWRNKGSGGHSFTSSKKAVDPVDLMSCYYAEKYPPSAVAEAATTAVAAQAVMPTVAEVPAPTLVAIPPRPITEFGTEKALFSIILWAAIWLIQSRTWRREKPIRNGAVFGGCVAVFLFGTGFIWRPSPIIAAEPLFYTVIFSLAGAAIVWIRQGGLKQRLTKAAVPTAQHTVPKIDLADEAHYEQIAIEIDTGRVHAATFTRAFVAAKGDPIQQKLKYIEMRLGHLREEEAIKVGTPPHVHV